MKKSFLLHYIMWDKISNLSKEEFLYNNSMKVIKRSVIVQMDGLLEELPFSDCFIFNEDDEDIENCPLNYNGKIHSKPLNIFCDFWHHFRSTFKCYCLLNLEIENSLKDKDYNRFIMIAKQIRDSILIEKKYNV